MALQAAQWGYVLKLGRLALEGDTDELMRSDDLAKAYLGDTAAAKHPLHA